jgi:hypothetical protein
LIHGKGKRIFLFSKTSKLALQATKPPIQWPPEALSLGLKLLECEADHSLTVSTNLRMHGTVPPPHICILVTVLDLSLSFSRAECATDCKDCSGYILDAIQFRKTVFIDFDVLHEKCNHVKQPAISTYKASKIHTKGIT